ncbi:MAG: TlpA disulfide reductase family protein [Candidatus Coatesbacteria bacterium]
MHTGRTLPKAAGGPVCLALAVALATAGCGGGAREGRKAPAFQLPDQKGATVKLADFRDRAVLLAFWTPWAGPCRMSLPQWGRLQRKYGKQGLAVVAITVFDDAHAAEKMLKENAASFPALTGDEAVIKAYLGRKEITLPVVFILDGRGRVVRRIAGFQRAEDLEPEVGRALATLQAKSGGSSATH